MFFQQTIASLISLLVLWTAVGKSQAETPKTPQPGKMSRLVSRLRADETRTVCLRIQRTPHAELDVELFARVVRSLKTAGIRVLRPEPGLSVIVTTVTGYQLESGAIESKLMLKDARGTVRATFRVEVGEKPDLDTVPTAGETADRTVVADRK